MGRFTGWTTALGLGLCLAGQALAAAPAKAPMTDADLQALVNNPKFGVMFQALETSFPADWKIFKSELIALANGGASEDAVSARSKALMAKLTSDHLLDVASAPAQDLAALFATETRFIESLSRENPTYCAEFGLSGLEDGAILSARSQRIQLEMVAALLRAARAGIDHPTARADLNAADLNLLVDALRARKVSDPLIELFKANKLGTADVSSQCSTSVAFYQAITDMPSESAGRWMTLLLTPGK